MTGVSYGGAHRDGTDDRSVRAFAVKAPRLRRAAVRLWGLTAQRDRADKSGRPSMHTYDVHHDVAS
jgi:hypothetical protein